MQNFRCSVVLVVEDEPFIRMAAADMITNAGFEVVEADSADEAIRILEVRSDIQLVFTDVDMPGTMDGVKLSHYIRHRWPPVKLIVASGKKLVAEDDLPKGAIFFSKPYSEHFLVEAIVGML